ncbi:MAG: pseudouridine synthase [Actinomycetota bacterium]
MNGTEGERLQKVLAHAGLASRRVVEDMIEQGRIKVNGAPARLGQRIDAAKDKVEVDGSLWPLATDTVYYLMNKPAGVVTTSSDPEGRATVLDLLDVGIRVWPVGRLDFATEGALVLTNDGDLTQQLTHPSFGISKTYLADVEGSVGPKAVRKLERGVTLDDGPSAPAGARIVERTPTTTMLEIVISEGRNRQVRRMMEAVGHPVRRLVRTGIGPLQVGRLKPGQFRRLAPQEVQALYGAVDEHRTETRHRTDKSTS